MACLYQLFAAGTPLKWISHIFRPKLLVGTGFCGLNCGFLVNVKINTSCSMQKEDFLLDTPLFSLLDSTFEIADTLENFKLQELFRLNLVAFPGGSES
jgi:hypothetical protein